MSAAENEHSEFIYSPCLQKNVVILPASAAKSCDQCQHQEGLHYCLFHGWTMKNMDMVRCAEFKYKK